MKAGEVNHRTFTMIFVGIATIACCLHIASVTAFSKVALANATTAVILGLFVCALEILVAKKYIGNCRQLLWIPFKMSKVVPGVLAFLLVFGLTLTCVQLFDQHKVFLGFHDLFKYLPIFLLNLVPSAMTEEWLFRFFPTVIVLKKSTLYSILYYLGITFLFMLIHFPKYYVEGNISDLPQVFLSGLALFVIFLSTQNLPFVVLIHAFTNKGWFLYDSTSNWLFLYVAILVVSLVWGLFNFIKIRSSNRAATFFIGGIR